MFPQQPTQLSHKKYHQRRQKTERGRRGRKVGKRGKKRDKQHETRRASTYRGNRDGEGKPSRRCRADSAWDARHLNHKRKCWRGQNPHRARGLCMKTQREGKQAATTLQTGRQPLKDGPNTKPRQHTTKQRQRRGSTRSKARAHKGNLQRNTRTQKR